MNEIYQELLNGFHEMLGWELVAVIFGVISVIFQKKNNILVYPTGLISTGIYVYLLSREHFKLYAEATLNAYYFVMSVYGWIYWARRRGQSHEHVKVSRSTSREIWTAIGIAAFGWAIFFYLLHTFSNSTTPAWDSFVSATACAGMWLLAKRKMENWILLNISNLVAIPLLFYKHLYLTTLLTIFLFIIAMFGYFSWRDEVLENESAAS
ncbi:nicotinamide mononucleotide transporter [Chitinophaga dinghuensis]|uniref:Nicotinamide riboside transporter PnuC n=1 Tax=Chitinophaga dinghuensis TaxID=1539050 RepID=A0A327W895_9BACT|nr:nicotinamide riboside transporter PnuC [Chitinophaga dinghuensis]RAJ85462.1 nicotinamide mononucleotide transporter [Chitinophaga dinghuensis]